MFTYPYKGACYENLGIMRKNKRKTHSKTDIGREALILDFVLGHEMGTVEVIDRCPKTDLLSTERAQQWSSECLTYTRNWRSTRLSNG